MIADETTTKQKAHKILIFFIAAIWMANGLFCKVLDMVPRHQQIVAVILGDTHARLWTLLIGISETVMAVWIVSGYRSRLNAIVQIIVIASMNAIEFVMAPDLLLWGRLNAVFALLFFVVIWYNESELNTHISR